MNVSFSGALLPAYHRNTTAGAAWVIPASPFDLGARSMTCECFDPDETCCMPSSTDIAPFCLPKDATCCGDTLCEAGEICCGNYCCYSDTTCSSDLSIFGCCPQGQTCDTQNPATCLDNTSPKRNGHSSPPSNCCPSSLPHCRSFGAQGYGCFDTPETSSSSSAPTSTSIDSVINAPEPLPNTADRYEYSGTTTLVETISVKYLSSGALSLLFPEPMTSNPAEWSISTTYVFSFPSTIFDVASASTTTICTSTTTSSKKSHTTTTTTSKSSSSSTKHPTSSTTIATKSTSHSTPLCWDPMVQTPLPCSPASSSSTTPPYPIATTLHSSASSTHSKSLITYTIIIGVICLALLFHLDFPEKWIVMAFWCVSQIAIYAIVLTKAWQALDEYSEKRNNDPDDGDEEKALREELSFW